MSSPRLAWVDAFKFLGIYAIYLGHLGSSAGNAYDFVFRYHVALFFFSAGFFTTNYFNTKAFVFIKKKSKTIIVPWLFFSLTFIILLSISESWNLDKLYNGLKEAIYGVRNNKHVGSLWFLNCIFVTFLIDYASLKLLRRNWLVLTLSFLAMIYTIGFMESSPRITPKWFWNLDSALSFWFYMAAGRVSFKYLNESTFFNISSKASWPLILISSITAVLYFYVGPGWLVNPARMLLDDKNKTVWFIFMFSYTTIGCLVLITFNVFLAKAITKINLFNKLGANTLHLCGLENIIKLLIPMFLSLLGISLVISNPINSYLYTFICLMAANIISIRLKQYIPFLTKT